jgi:hypothetical protein
LLEAVALFPHLSKKYRHLSKKHAFDLNRRGFKNYVRTILERGIEMKGRLCLVRSPVLASLARSWQALAFSAGGDGPESTDFRA